MSLNSVRKIISQKRYGDIFSYEVWLNLKFIGPEAKCAKIDQRQVELKQNKIYHGKNFALELPSGKSYVMKRNENIKK